MSELSSRKTKHKRKRKRNKKYRPLKWTLWTMLIVIIGVIAYYGYSIADFANGIQSRSDEGKFPGTGKTDQVSAPPKWEGKERVNILLIGGDARDATSNGYPRSDALMVASVDPVTKKAHLMSVLRDTYVDIPGGGKNRVNSALSRGGPHLAMETVSQLLDIPIQYYVYVDFQGFINLIDAIGGVELEVEKDMYYSTRADGPEYDINLKAGLQVLDGSKALQYARFRNDFRNDYGRTERQRKLMKALAGELISTSSILKLPKILNAIEPYIETNMTLSNMLKLGSLGFDIRNETIESIQIPPPDNLYETELSSGAKVITFNQQRLHDFIQELFNADEETDVEQADGTHTVNQAELAMNE